MTPHFGTAGCSPPRPKGSRRGFEIEAATSQGKAAAGTELGFTFLQASGVLHDVATRTVAPHLPCGQHGAGNPLGALAAPAVVGLGQAEQVAGVGDAGVLPWHRGKDWDTMRAGGFRPHGKPYPTQNPALGSHPSFFGLFQAGKSPLEILRPPEEEASPLPVVFPL